MIRQWTMVWIVMMASPALAKDMTLDRLYQMATDRAEQILIGDHNVKIAKERKKQAVGGVLPSLEAGYRVIRQDIPDQGGGGTSAFRQPEQTTSRMTLRQPLYRGGAEYAVMRIANLGVDQAQQGLLENKRLLFLDLAQYFFRGRSLQKDIEHVKSLQQTLDSRVRELQRRVQIGKSKQADLLTARAQASAIQSEILNLESQLDVTMQELKTLSGVTELSGLSEEDGLPAHLQPLDYYISRLHHRPDLQVAEQEFKTAEQSVKVAQSGNWPSIDVEGNYYFKRPGVLADSEWDVSLNVVLPLFEGGRTASRIREVTLGRSTEELRLRQLRRYAETEVRNQYQRTQSFLNEVNVLRETVRLSEASYKAQMNEYRLGIISFLEAIQAEREYWESVRGLDRRIYDLKLSWAQLQAAIGEWP